MKLDNKQDNYNYFKCRECHEIWHEKYNVEIIEFYYRDCCIDCYNEMEK